MLPARSPGAHVALQRRARWCWGKQVRLEVGRAGEGRAGRQASNDWHGVGVHGPGPRGHQSQTGVAHNPLPLTHPAPATHRPGHGYRMAAGRPRVARKAGYSALQRPRGFGLQPDGPPPCQLSWPALCPGAVHTTRAWAQSPACAGVLRQQRARLRGHPRPAGTFKQQSPSRSACSHVVGMLQQQSH